MAKDESNTSEKIGSFGDLYPKKVPAPVACAVTSWGKSPETWDSSLPWATRLVGPNVKGLGCIAIGTAIVYLHPRWNLPGWDVNPVFVVTNQCARPPFLRNTSSHPVEHSTKLMVIPPHHENSLSTKHLREKKYQISTKTVGT